MLIYFYLFIVINILSAEPSSLRGSNSKNDLVPILTSKADSEANDDNSLKIVSNEPFIIELGTSSEVRRNGGARGDRFNGGEDNGDDNDNMPKRERKSRKRKKSAKKRIASKLKEFRKRHRIRRNAFYPNNPISDDADDDVEKVSALDTAPEDTSDQNWQEKRLQSTINRHKMFEALDNAMESNNGKSLIERVQGENLNEGEEDSSQRNNNILLRLPSLTSNQPLVALRNPLTSKIERNSLGQLHKSFTSNLEKKINHLREILKINGTDPDTGFTSEEGIRVRRKSESDRAANKIARMFLALSAMNGYNERRRSNCKDTDEVDDDWGDEDVKEMEASLKKIPSKNEERYKVKKWIEYMKNKRSNKFCPCKGTYYEEDDAFPLESEITKASYGRDEDGSKEDTYSSQRRPYLPRPDYLSRHKCGRYDYTKRRHPKLNDLDEVLRAISDKRKLGQPLEDLELYRSRARKILENAEEILNKIKEEEEKRLAAPSYLNRLKELTSRIHSNPRNNENNDFIRILHKNLGWDDLSKIHDGDHDEGGVKDGGNSLLDQYEKAKQLGQNNAKQLSSYLLRNLGKLREDEKEGNADAKALKPGRKEKPQRLPLPKIMKSKVLSDSLKKEYITPNYNGTSHYTGKGIRLPDATKQTITKPVADSLSAKADALRIKNRAPLGKVIKDVLKEQEDQLQKDAKKLIDGTMKAKAPETLSRNIPQVKNKNLKIGSDYIDNIKNKLKYNKKANELRKPGGNTDYETTTREAVEKVESRFPQDPDKMVIDLHPQESTTFSTVRDDRLQIPKQDQFERLASTEMVPIDRLASTIPRIPLTDSLDKVKGILNPGPGGEQLEKEVADIAAKMAQIGEAASKAGQSTAKSLERDLLTELVNGQGLYQLPYDNVASQHVINFDESGNSNPAIKNILDEVAKELAEKNKDGISNLQMRYDGANTNLNNEGESDWRDKQEMNGKMNNDRVQLKSAEGTPDSENRDVRRLNEMRKALEGLQKNRSGENKKVIGDFKGTDWKLGKSKDGIADRIGELIKGKLGGSEIMDENVMGPYEMNPENEFQIRNPGGDEIGEGSDGAMLRKLAANDNGDEPFRPDDIQKRKIQKMAGNLKKHEGDDDNRRNPVLKEIMNYDKRNEDVKENMAGSGMDLHTTENGEGEINNRNQESKAKDGSILGISKKNKDNSEDYNEDGMTEKPNLMQHMNKDEFGTYKKILDDDSDVRKTTDQTHGGLNPKSEHSNDMRLQNAKSGSRELMNPRSMENFNEDRGENDDSRPGGVLRKTKPKYGQDDSNNKKSRNSNEDRLDKERVEKMGKPFETETRGSESDSGKDNIDHLQGQNPMSKGNEGKVKGYGNRILERVNGDDLDDLISRQRAMGRDSLESDFGNLEPGQKERMQNEKVQKINGADEEDDEYKPERKKGIYDPENSKGGSAKLLNSANEYDEETGTPGLQRVQDGNLRGESKGKSTSNEDGISNLKLGKKPLGNTEIEGSEYQPRYQQKYLPNPGTKGHRAGSEEDGSNEPNLRSSAEAGDDRDTYKKNLKEALTGILDDLKTIEDNYKSELSSSLNTGDHSVPKTKTGHDSKEPNNEDPKVRGSFNRYDEEKPKIHNLLDEDLREKQFEDSGNIGSDSKFDLDDQRVANKNPERGLKQNEPDLKSYLGESNLKNTRGQQNQKPKTDSKETNKKYSDFKSSKEDDDDFEENVEMKNSERGHVEDDSKVQKVKVKDVQRTNNNDVGSEYDPRKSDQLNAKGVHSPQLQKIRETDSMEMDNENVELKNSAGPSNEDIVQGNSQSASSLDSNDGALRKPFAAGDRIRGQKLQRVMDNGLGKSNSGYNKFRPATKGSGQSDEMDTEEPREMMRNDDEESTNTGDNSRSSSGQLDDSRIPNLKMKKSKPEDVPGNLNPEGPENDSNKGNIFDRPENKIKGSKVHLESKAPEGLGSINQYDPENILKKAHAGDSDLTRSNGRLDENGSDERKTGSGSAEKFNGNSVLRAAGGGSGEAVDSKVQRTDEGFRRQGNNEDDTYEPVAKSKYEYRIPNENDPNFQDIITEIPLDRNGEENLYDPGLQNMRIRNNKGTHDEGVNVQSRHGEDDATEADDSWEWSNSKSEEKDDVEPSLKEAMEPGYRETSEEAGLYDQLVEKIKEGDLSGLFKGASGERKMASTEKENENVQSGKGVDELGRSESKKAEGLYDSLIKETPSGNEKSELQSLLNDFDKSAYDPSVQKMIAEGSPDNYGDKNNFDRISNGDKLQIMRQPEEVNGRDKNDEEVRSLLNSDDEPGIKIQDTDSGEIFQKGDEFGDSVVRKMKLNDDDDKGTKGSQLERINKPSSKETSERNKFDDSDLIKAANDGNEDIYDPIVKKILDQGSKGILIPSDNVEAQLKNNKPESLSANQNGAKGLYNPIRQEILEESREPQLGRRNQDDEQGISDPVVERILSTDSEKVKNKNIDSTSPARNKNMKGEPLTKKQQGSSSLESDEENGQTQKFSDYEGQGKVQEAASKMEENPSPNNPNLKTMSKHQTGFGNYKVGDQMASGERLYEIGENDQKATSEIDKDLGLVNQNLRNIMSGNSKELRDYDGEGEARKTVDERPDFGNYNVQKAMSEIDKDINLLNQNLKKMTSSIEEVFRDYDNGDNSQTRFGETDRDKTSVNPMLRKMASGEGFDDYEIAENVQKAASEIYKNLGQANQNIMSGNSKELGEYDGEETVRKAGDEADKKPGFGNYNVGDNVQKAMSETDDNLGFMNQNLKNMSGKSQELGDYEDEGTVRKMADEMDKRPRFGQKATSETNKNLGLVNQNLKNIMSGNSKELGDYEDEGEARRTVDKKPGFGNYNVGDNVQKAMSETDDNLGFMNQKLKNVMSGKSQELGDYDDEGTVPKTADEMEKRPGFGNYNFGDKIEKAASEIDKNLGFMNQKLKNIMSGNSKELGDYEDEGTVRKTADEMDKRPRFGQKATGETNKNLGLMNQNLKNIMSGKSQELGDYEDEGTVRKTADEIIKRPGLGNYNVGDKIEKAASEIDKNLGFMNQKLKNIMSGNSKELGDYEDEGTVRKTADEMGKRPGLGNYNVADKLEKAMSEIDKNLGLMKQNLKNIMSGESQEPGDNEDEDNVRNTASEMNKVPGIGNDDSGEPIQKATSELGKDFNLPNQNLKKATSGEAQEFGDYDDRDEAVKEINGGRNWMNTNLGKAQSEEAQAIEDYEPGNIQNALSHPTEEISSMDPNPRKIAFGKPLGSNKHKIGESIPKTMSNNEPSLRKTASGETQGFEEYDDEENVQKNVGDDNINLMNPDPRRIESGEEWEFGKGRIPESMSKTDENENSMNPVPKIASGETQGSRDYDADGNVQKTLAEDGNLMDPILRKMTSGESQEYPEYEDNDNVQAKLQEDSSMNPNLRNMASEKARGSHPYKINDNIRRPASEIDKGLSLVKSNSREKTRKESEGLEEYDDESNVQKAMSDTDKGPSLTGTDLRKMAPDETQDFRDYDADGNVQRALAEDGILMDPILRKMTSGESQELPEYEDNLQKTVSEDLNSRSPNLKELISGKIPQFNEPNIRDNIQKAVSDIDKKLSLIKPGLRKIISGETDLVEQDEGNVEKSRSDTDEGPNLKNIQSGEIRYLANDEKPVSDEDPYSLKSNLRKFPTEETQGLGDYNTGDKKAISAIDEAFDRLNPNLKNMASDNVPEFDDGDIRSVDPNLRKMAEFGARNIGDNVQKAMSAIDKGFDSLNPNLKNMASDNVPGFDNIDENVDKVLSKIDGDLSSMDPNLRKMAGFGTRNIGDNIPKAMSGTDEGFNPLNPNLRNMAPDNVPEFVNTDDGDIRSVDPNLRKMAEFGARNIGDNVQKPTSGIDEGFNPLNPNLKNMASDSVRGFDNIDENVDKVLSEIDGDLSSMDPNLRKMAEFGARNIDDTVHKAMSAIDEGFDRLNPNLKNMASDNVPGFGDTDDGDIRSVDPNLRKMAEFGARNIGDNIPKAMSVIDEGFNPLNPNISPDNVPEFDNIDENVDKVLSKIDGDIRSVDPNLRKMAEFGARNIGDNIPKAMSGIDEGSDPLNLNLKNLVSERVPGFDKIDENVEKVASKIDGDLSSMDPNLRKMAEFGARNIGDNIPKAMSGIDGGFNPLNSNLKNMASDSVRGFDNIDENVDKVLSKIDGDIRSMDPNLRKMAEFGARNIGDNVQKAMSELDKDLNMMNQNLRKMIPGKAQKSGLHEDEDNDQQDLSKIYEDANLMEANPKKIAKIENTDDGLSAENLKATSNKYASIRDEMSTGGNENLDDSRESKEAPLSITKIDADEKEAMKWERLSSKEDIGRGNSEKSLDYDELTANHKPSLEGEKGDANDYDSEEVAGELNVNRRPIVSYDTQNIDQRESFEKEANTDQDYPTGDQILEASHDGRSSQEFAEGDGINDDDDSIMSEDLKDWPTVKTPKSYPKGIRKPVIPKANTKEDPETMSKTTDSIYPTPFEDEDDYLKSLRPGDEINRPKGTSSNAQRQPDNGLQAVTDEEYPNEKYLKTGEYPFASNDRVSDAKPKSFYMDYDALLGNDDSNEEQSLETHNGLWAKHPFEDDTPRYLNDPLVAAEHSDCDPENSKAIYPQDYDVIRKPFSAPRNRFNGEPVPRPRQLKMPKTIQKIVKDLDDGKIRGDEINSIDGLNPEKIDYLIGKLDAAEQYDQNQDDECRKECACADEIELQSRKIGRYEIAKDILTWMKDLRMNRVLSDD